MKKRNSDLNKLKKYDRTTIFCTLNDSAVK